MNKINKIDVVLSMLQTESYLGSLNEKTIDKLYSVVVSDLARGVVKEPVAKEKATEANTPKKVKISFKDILASVASKEPVAKEVVKEPVAKEVVKEPVAKEVVKEPVVKEPVAKEPVAKEPVAKEPVAKEPVAKEVVKEPVAKEVVKEPVAKEVVKEPVKEPVKEAVVSDKVEILLNAEQKFIQSLMTATDSELLDQHILDKEVLLTTVIKSFDGKGAVPAELKAFAQIIGLLLPPIFNVGKISSLTRLNYSLVTYCCNIGLADAFISMVRKATTGGDIAKEISDAGDMITSQLTVIFGEDYNAKQE